MRRTAATVAVAFAVAGCGGPPRDDAASLVPADAQLYVHATLEDDRLVKRLERFTVAEPLLAEYEEIRPWLGDEAAFARTHRGELTLLAFEDEAGARAWAAANGGELRDGFVVLGEAADGDALADAPDYADADLPADTVVRARLTGLPPLFGDGPVVAGVELTDDGAHLEAQRVGGASADGDFEPSLLDGVPDDAFAYLSVRGLALASGLLPEAADPLVGLLGGEVALSVAPGEVDPVVTLTARVEDPAAAQEALASLQGAIAAVLTPPGDATGQVPVLTERDLGEGISGFSLTLAGGGELVYAVDGDRVAIASDEAGVRRALMPEEGLGGSRVFEEAVPVVPDDAQALAFFASSQLLELADEVGLDASEAYRALRADLARIRALGAVVRRRGNDTTLDMDLLTE